MTSVALLNQPAKFPDLLRNWRKIRKHSQSDLSLTAGISQRHLSFLESGRSSPSREMVLLLANSLELPLREQNALLNAAGYTGVYSHAGIDQEELTQAHHALDVMLKHHEPFPAIVVDRNWNILMMNNANLKVFGEFVNPTTVWQDIGPGKAPNVLRLSLHPKGLRAFTNNWQILGQYFLNNLNSELNSNPYNREARELLDEISNYPDMPDTHLPPDGFKPYLTFELEKPGLKLTFFSLISTFGTPQDVTLQEIRIETFFPANDTTESFLRQL